MPEKPDPSNQRDNSAGSSIPPLIKAYIDTEIKKTNEHEGETRKKKWKNSWRASSPITKGTFMLTSGIAVATIAYAIIADRQLAKMSGQLNSMNKTYDEIHRQTRAVQGSEYMACLNAQAAQAAFFEAHNSFADTHATSVAAIQQAAIGNASERAIISVLPSMPDPERLGGGHLGIPFIIKNKGRSSASNLNVWATAVLLEDGQIFKPEKVYRKAGYR